MMPSMKGIEWTLLAALVAACSPAATTTVAPPTPPKASAPKVAPRWVLKASRMATHVESTQHGTIFGGTDGMRWLRPTGNGVPTHAADFLPEEPIGIAVNESEVAFVGRTGTVYASKTPVSPVVATRKPSVALHAVSVGKDAIVGTDGRSLYRSIDHGATWSKTELAIGAGVITRVELRRSGAGAATIAPERSFLTRDDGATWSPLTTIYAVSDVLKRKGEVYLYPNIKVVDQAPGWVYSTDLHESVPSPWEDAPWSHKEPEKFGLGGWERNRGLLRGAKWLEPIPTNARKDVAVLENALDSRSAPAKLFEIPDCWSPRFAANASTILVGCYARGATDNDHRIILHRHDGKGLPTSKDDELTTAEDHGDMWLGPDGTVIVENACTGASSSQCKGTWARRAPGGAFHDVTFGDRAPHAFALSFSTDGRNVYAVAAFDAKEVVALISRDGGEHFERKSLITQKPDTGDCGAIALDGNGVRAMSMNLSGGCALFRTGDDGKTWKRALLPDGTRGISFAGVRGLASASAGMFESNDAGATWHQVAPPLGTYDLRCSDAGCRVTNWIARIGWDDTPGAPIASTDKKLPPLASAGTFHCKLSGKWTDTGETLIDAESMAPLSGVRRASGCNLDGGLPGVCVEKKTPQGPTVERTSLFFYPKKKVDFRFLDGPRQLFTGEIAAVRTMDPEGKKQQKLELAVWSPKTNKVQHSSMTLSDVGDKVRIVGATADAVVLAANDALHLVRGATQKRFSWPDKDQFVPFVDLGVNPSFRPIAVPSGDRLLLFYVYDGRLTIAWSPPGKNEGWQFRTTNLWPGAQLATFVGGDPQSSPFVTGTAPSLAVVWSGRDPGVLGSFSFAIPNTPKDDLVPVAFPTQTAFGSPPRVCAASSDKSPRVLVPWTRGARHAVVITGDGSADGIDVPKAPNLTTPFTIATSYGVARLDPSGTCVAGYDTQPVTGQFDSYYTSLVAQIWPDDLEHAALYEVIHHWETHHATYVRPMQCTRNSDPPPESARGIVGF